MQNKLQELTDKLYNEGLLKGKAEGEAQRAQAKEEAAAIIKAAQEKADAIVAEAEKKAEETKAKAESDIKMASGQAIMAIKQQVESLITAKAVAEPVAKAMEDDSFLKEIVKLLVEKFNPASAESSDLAVILPESQKAALAEFLQKSVSKELGKGLDVTFSKEIKAGARIAPKGAGYFISFTDEDFQSILANYLRPATKKILFG